MSANNAKIQSVLETPFTSPTPALYMFRRMLKAENCKSMMKMNGYWIRLSFLIG